MILRPICLVILIAAWANKAPAADADGNYAIWGVGRTSCNQFNEAHEKGDLTAYKEFLMGYLTAYNTLTPDTYKVTGSNSLADLMTQLNRYCKANKLDSFERAVKRMVASQHETRQRTAPGKSRGWGRPPREPSS